VPESSEPVEVGLCDQIAAVVYIVLVDEHIVYNNKLCDLLWTCTRRRRTGPRGGIVALWSSRGHQHDGFTRATVPCGQLVLTPVALHYSSVPPCRLGLYAPQWNQRRRTRRLIGVTNSVSQSSVRSNAQSRRYAPPRRRFVCTHMGVDLQGGQKSGTSHSRP